jgi:hypothetical protein
MGNRLFIHKKLLSQNALETWNLEFGVRLFCEADVGQSVAMIGDGQQVVACTPGCIHVWDSDTANEAALIQTSLVTTENLNSVCLFTCDDDFTLCPCMQYYLHETTTEIWNIRTGASVFRQSMKISHANFCTVAMPAIL